MIRNVLTTSIHSNTQRCVFTRVDNPWLSSSVKTNRFSSRAGLDAQLITGEEISLPSGSSPAAPSMGMLLSPSPSPYHLPLGGASPAAGQLAAVKAGILEGTIHVTKLAGLLFTPKELSSFMGQPGQCQTDTWG